MSKHVYIEDIAAYEGQTITLKGWIYNRSSKGKLHFLQVRDGTGILQAVMFKGDVSPELFTQADHLPQETSVIVTGEVRKDARSAAGFELSVKDLQVISTPTTEYPISPKEHGTAFLMDHRHLWLRSRRQWAILRIRATLAGAIRAFFDGRGFTLLDAPIFTPNACEGTTNLFETPYFDSKAYLTQSGQLYMEAAAMALGKVYCFGPAFRAEKSKTRRHLTEFWMVEPEVAYLDMEGDMELAEDFLCFLVDRVLNTRRKELEVLERDISALEKIQKPFPRIHYNDAIEQLHKLGSDITWGDDFGGDDETMLTKEYDRPIMVHRYPAEVKAFYMKKDPENPKLALGFDVLAPEGYGEIIGGGQREDSLDKLIAEITRHQLPQEFFEWYLDLRRYGSVPHSGFGLGLERTVAWVCGLPHVRETTGFPRMLERLTP
jgi:asparaginyl-tRNA synthetase